MGDHERLKGQSFWEEVKLGVTVLREVNGLKLFFAIFSSGLLFTLASLGLSEIRLGWPVETSVVTVVWLVGGIGGFCVIFIGCFGADSIGGLGCGIFPDTGA